MLKTILEVICALLLLSFVVFFHEFGHYVFAKFFRVEVRSFSIGIGNVIKEFIDKDGVSWRISILPIGGYLEIVEKKEEVKNKYKYISLEELAPGKNMLISLAGPLFNFILYFVIFLGLFSLNNVYFDKEDENIIIKQEGLGKILDKEDQNIVLQIVNNTKTAKNYIKLSFYDSMNVIFKKFVRLTKNSLNILKISKKNLSGPLGILYSLIQIIKNGSLIILSTLALLSLALGIFNLFPLPALDGGSILISLIELILNKKLNEKYSIILNYISIGILLLLFFYVTTIDCNNLLTKGASK